MPEVDRYTATRRGPGTIRDPLEVAQPDDDVSDELSDESGNERIKKDKAEQPCCSSEQPAETILDQQLNQFEMPLGLETAA